jgi:predicted extracellular nuclease
MNRWTWIARLVLGLALVVSGAQSSAQVVISQVYGGGGNANAVWTHDFVELFNRGATAQDLTGWSIQYTSANGNTWGSNSFALPPVTLQPGQYFLIQLASGGSNGAPLPTPDASAGTINMAAASGKVLLASTSTSQSGSNCPSGSDIVDLVPYGSTNCSPSAPTLSATLAALRAEAGCADTGNPESDFAAATPAPRNSTSAFNLCEADLPPPSADSQLVISQVFGGGGNTGAPLNQDYVEIFNRGETVVLLDGLSLQYGPATGNFAGSGANPVVPLPVFGLQPGQYFLIGLATGSQGGPLPDPDAEGTPNLAASNGKLALVQGTESLACGATATPCSGAQLERILDLVGFGTANLFEGNAAAPAPSNTTALFRAAGGCIDSDRNHLDFALGAPTPRNAASPRSPCASAAPGEEPTLNLFDAAVLEGGSGEFPVMRFLVRLTSPAVGDVGLDIFTFDTGSALAGEDYLANAVLGATIPNGETDFVFEVTVIGNDTFQGNRSFGVAVEGLSGDVFPGRLVGTGTIVEDEPVPTSICEIQASGIAPSPMLGERRNVFGVVTAIIGNGYFVQHSDDVRAADPFCSDGVSSGIFVFMGGNFDPGTIPLAVGDAVMVTGTVTEFLPASAQDQFPLRQLSDSAQTQVLASGHPLPTPVLLDADLDLGPDVDPDRLQRYLGMRVAAPYLRVTGPGLGDLAQQNASVAPSGVFFAAPLVHPRPLREPGVDVVDLLSGVLPFPGGVQPPLFDGNPEVLRIDSAAQRMAPLLDLETGAEIAGLRGVLSYGFKRYTLMPDPDAPVLIDPSGVPVPRPVRSPAYEEFTVASFNVLNLEDFPVLTAEALGRRLNTLSRAICQDLGTPDVLGLIELGTSSVLEKLRDAINGNQYGHCDFDPQYSAHFTPPTFAGMGTGYLIARYEVAPGVPRVSGTPYAVGGSEVPLITPLVPPTLAALFDRPPLVLDATVHQDNGAGYPITVVLNHLRSLLSLTDPRPPNPGGQTAAEGWPTMGHRVREKRLQGAAWLADWIQQRQLAQPGVPILVMGDLNAFEFSDGYIDVVGILKGEAAPPDQVLLARSQISGDDPQLDPVAVDPPLLNLVEVLPEAERYSYVFAGSAQTLDHILVSEALLATVDAVDFDFARINADFAASNFSQPAAGRRTSDHDPAIAYLAPPAFRSADLALSVLAEDGPILPGDTATFDLALLNPGPNVAAQVSLGVSVTTPCGPAASGELSGPDGWTCSGLAQVSGTLAGSCTIPAFGIDAAAFTVAISTCDDVPDYLVALAATVASDTADRTPADNDAEATVSVRAVADLRVGVDGPGEPVDVGQVAAFSVQATNDGPSPVDAGSQAVLSISINTPAASVQLVRDGSALFTCADPVEAGATTLIECEVGTHVPESGSETFGIQVSVVAALSGAQLTVSAGIASALEDPDPGNNLDAAAVEVNPAPAAIFGDGFE